MFKIRMIGAFVLLMITIETWPVIPLVGSLVLAIVLYCKFLSLPKTKTASSSEIQAERKSVPCLKSYEQPISNESKNMSVEKDIENLPNSIMTRSRSLFYTGTAAFSNPTDLYILGLNPGGSPLTQDNETVARHLAEWSSLPAHWSSYLDESWQGRPPGTHGMQPRMRHMFDRLGRNLRTVPASNVFSFDRRQRPRFRRKSRRCFRNAGRCMMQ